MAIAASMAFLAPSTRAQTHTTAYDDDGMVTVNLERRFILGLYGHSKPDEVVDLDLVMRECATTGFNLVYVHGKNASAKAAAASSNGLMTWASVGAPRTEEHVLSFRRTVKRAAALPGLAFVESVDEPAWSLQKPGRRVPPEALVRGYAHIKQLMPNRLVYTNHAPTGSVSTLQRYNAGTDIVAVDVYPVKPHDLLLPDVLFEDGRQTDSHNPYISLVGEYVRKMRQVAGPGRPVFSVQQAFAWAMLQPEDVRDERQIRYPTHGELRFMAYQAIIERATGILYWGSYLTPKPSTHWDAVKQVVHELAAIENVLTAPSVALTPEIHYREMGHSVDVGLSVLFKDVDDVLYAFICNADPLPCRATLSGIGEWRRASVLEESRELELRNGTLTDDWAGFGVHVYRFER